MRVTPQGDTINSFPICNRADAQFSPSVVFNGENYIVTWTDRRFTGTYFWTVAARVTPQGAVLDTGNCIGATDAHNEFYPNTAFDGNRCLTIWHHSYYEPYGIYGRFVDSSAQPEDTVITVAATSSYLYNFPKVEFGDSNYLVVWADERAGETDLDILGQLVSSQGMLVGGKITIATGSEEQRRPDVSFDGTNFLIIWVEDIWIFGQRISPAGQLIGPNFLISDTTINTRTCPRLCAGSSNYLVAWSEERGSYCDIYGNIDVGTSIYEEVKTSPRYSECYTTIITGPLILPSNRKCKVYDISGRTIEPHQISRGIYFVEIDGQITRKVVKLR